jgi:hypothetical protein
MDGEDPRILKLLEQARAERAPEQLRARIAAMQVRRTPARPRLRPAWSLASAVALAALVAVLALALPSGTPGGPSISQAAALGLRPAESAAPAVDPNRPSLLLDRVGALSFPNWSWDGHWRAVGRRSDRIGGRRIETVYYRSAGQTLAYSIVSGAALKLPANHPEYGYSFTIAGHSAYTWHELGHTCILSSATVGPAVMRALAGRS